MRTGSVGAAETGIIGSGSSDSLLSRAVSACGGPGPPSDPAFCLELSAWIGKRLSGVGLNVSSTWSGVPPTLSENFTSSSSDEVGSPPVIAAALSVLLGILILVTVLGNVFVIAAILMERNLQNVANYLIVSLAVADLMVACLVMPLGAVYEISEGWILGPELCDMWTSSDVLCCTASILHLVAIAVDRYWAVTNVDYIHNRNGNRIILMIALVWSVALVVSIAPQLGWKDPAYLERITLQQRCLVSQDLGYQIFATCSTFYVPLLVILILYWKIYQTARKRIRRRGAHQRSSPDSNQIRSGFFSRKKKCLDCEAGKERANEDGASTAFTISKQATTKGKESLEAKRERKAAKTLAIITGAFVVCWLPFFLMALLLPLCPACQISDTLASLFLWLGYLNSALNPVIYTVFSPEFRHAFKRILCGVSRPLR